MTYELTAEEHVELAPKAVLDGVLDMYGKNRPAWIHRSELDLRVGGTWTVDFGPPGPPAFREDRVITAYQPDRRLAYTVTATHEDAPPLRTTVEIDCEPLGDHSRVRLTQGPFPTIETQDEFAGAWHDVLDLLETTVERRA